MSAPVIIINRLTGSGPTLTEIDGTTNRANAADLPTPGTTDPIQVPGSGTNYSYWVSTQLDCTVAPTTLVDNLTWYTNGTNNFGTGVTCELYDSASATYAQASGIPGISGASMASAYEASPYVNAFTYTSSSVRTINGSTSGTGAFGNLAVYQIQVGTTASPGVTGTPNTFTWDYEWY